MHTGVTGAIGSRKALQPLLPRVTVEIDVEAIRAMTSKRADGSLSRAVADALWLVQHVGHRIHGYVHDVKHERAPKC